RGGTAKTPRRSSVATAVVFMAPSPLARLSAERHAARGGEVLRKHVGLLGARHRLRLLQVVEEMALDLGERRLGGGARAGRDDEREGLGGTDEVEPGEIGEPGDPRLDRCPDRRPIRRALGNHVDFWAVLLFGTLPDLDARARPADDGVVRVAAPRRSLVVP